LDQLGKVDSLVVYNKYNSWEILHSFRLASQKESEAKLSIDPPLISQLYLFTEDGQQPIGELYLASNSTIDINFNPKNPTESVSFSGDFSEINNYFATRAKSEYILSELAKQGGETSQLNNAISSAKESLGSSLNSENIPDSIYSYVNTNFDSFSDILLKKHSKYQYKLSLIGKEGINFTFLDPENQDFSLNQFLGKYVYIDVWATWCVPCKKEYPFLKELEEAFQEENGLAIISLSIDSDKSKWQNYIDKNNMSGIHLYTGNKSDFVTFYDIGAIPRFILIDPMGHVVNSDEIRPSDLNLQPLLNQLILQTKS
jgi:thiol-disulfide isomerase/thioredoxin